MKTILSEKVNLSDASLAHYAARQSQNLIQKSESHEFDLHTGHTSDFQQNICSFSFLYLRKQGIISHNHQ